MDFSGQTIWVTGAGQGIGRSVAEGFAQLGGQVIGFDLSFPEQDYGFTRYVLDIGDAQAVQQACSNCRQCGSKHTHPSPSSADD
jgi:2,3-dihydro-2,3-dihydroxybenzoate dehydrogenase